LSRKSFNKTIYGVKKLENKTVFITGGLSGIGLACAIAAIKEGADVAVVDLRSSNSDKAILEIKKENPNGILFINTELNKY